MLDRHADSFNKFRQVFVDYTRKRDLESTESLHYTHLFKQMFQHLNFYGMCFVNLELARA